MKINAESNRCRHYYVHLCTLNYNMRKLILLYFISISFFSIGQNTILSEDFNDGFPIGWQLNDFDGFTPANDPAVSFIDDAWVMHEDYDSLGINDSILVSTSWFEEDGAADDYLILPSVTLGAYGNYISFDIKSKDGSFPDGLDVFFTTTDLSPWTFTHNDTIYHNEAVSPYWTNVKVSLDSVGLTNQDVILAFRHFGTDKFILALDNIKITTNDPVGISEVSDEGYSIYPNPAKNELFIEGSENESYFITDLNGKIISEGRTNYNIKLNLNPGIYFLNIENKRTKKLIIN